MSLVNNNNSNNRISNTNNSSNSSISSSSTNVSSSIISSSSTKKSSSSSSSTTSTVITSSSGNNIGSGGIALNNHSNNSLNSKKQEALDQAHRFQEEDNPLTPPAISFTTLITDYETELMAFSDASRSPSPQPQPDLLIDIHDDGNTTGTTTTTNGTEMIINNNTCEPQQKMATSAKSVETIIDESADMIINNKNLLMMANEREEEEAGHEFLIEKREDNNNKDFNDDDEEEEFDQHDSNNENSLTSTTTLDTVIAVGDLASIIIQQPQQQQQQNEKNHGSIENENILDEADVVEIVEDGLVNNIENDDMQQQQLQPVDPVEQEEEGIENNQIFDDELQNQKEMKNMKSVTKKISTSSCSSTSSSTSTLGKQSSIEKVEQHEEHKEQKKLEKSSIGGKTTAKEECVKTTVNGTTINNNGHVSTNVDAVEVNETTKSREQDGVLKQKKKNATSSINMLVDDDSDDEIGYEHTTENTQSNDTVDFITNNGTNDFIVKTNGFHTVENGNSLEANQVEKLRKNPDFLNEKEFHATTMHELDDNEVFTSVSVSKLKSSFSKFDNLSRGENTSVTKEFKTSQSNEKIPIGAANDSSKALQNSQEQPKKPKEHICKCCGKAIFVMELVRAEKEDWHKTCFRCSICKKSLGVDSYCSNEGILYCKPHFRELFQPKPVFDQNGEDEVLDEEARKKKRAEIIIRESEPVQLPPDVVKSTVYDTSERFAELEELSKTLDVKSKFERFKTLGTTQEQEQQLLEPVKRSSSAVLQSRVAKYQSAVTAATMESTGTTGVLDSELGQIPSGGIQEQEDESDDEGVIKLLPKKIHPSEEINAEAVDSVRSKWEANGFNLAARKDEARKEEQIKFRSKLLHGKSNQIKEMYEKAVTDSTSPTSSGSSPNPLEELGSVAKAKELKEKFEKEVLNGNAEDSINKAAMMKDEIFESEITKTSRNLFKELDKSASTVGFQPMKSESKTVISKQHHNFDAKDIVRSSDTVDDVTAPSDISNKFQFFEKYTEEQKNNKEKKQFRITPPREGVVKEATPDREIYRDPNIVRACDTQEDDTPLKTTTASKMLSVFRQMELEQQQQNQQNALKPLKEFTPPREQRFANGGTNGHDQGGSDEEDDDSEAEQQRHQFVEKDEILKQVGSLARASSLRAKFEIWNDSNQPDLEDDSDGGTEHRESSPQNENVIAPSIDTTKNLRAKFERIKEEEMSNHKKETNKRPIKRFVELTNNSEPMDCAMCEKKVYAMEKLEAQGKVYHKTCFKCSQCKCVLRMDNFTSNRGTLFCKPHFKQLFKIKGNYDEGFGYESQKREWEKKHGKTAGGADENEKEN